MGATITLKNLSIGYRSKHQLRTVASAIDAQLQSGKLTCLIGANGIGKSTLLRTLAGFQPAISGEIRINHQEKESDSPTKESTGKPISDLSPKDLAKEIGVVLTSKPDAAQLSVEEIVGIGRSPHTGFWGTLSPRDKQIVTEALQQVGIQHLAHRNIQELSDGERQKVMIAKALAQQTSIIILDEPTAFLDFPSKVETLQMLRRLAHEQHKAILFSTHDVELALQLADCLWLMERPVQHSEEIPEESTLSVGTPRELADNGRLSRFIERDGIHFEKAELRFKIEP